MLRNGAPLTLVRRAQKGQAALGIRPFAGQFLRASSHAAGADVFTATDQFLHRHMGSQGEDRQAMLTKLGFKDMESLIDATLPPQIRLSKKLSLDAPLSETEALASLKRIMSKNKVLKSFIGAGYYETIVPGVIQRNVLENPGWYTAYTPYQAEIAQGRLQSLLNFQTMVTDLTGMALSNASLLDEATAAAEAMAMTFSLCSQKRSKFFVDARCHPQTIALTQTRGKALGMTVIVGDAASAALDATYCGAMVQYPDTYGGLHDWSAFVAAAHAHEILTVACTDLLASVCVKPVGEVGFDIAVGSAQRFGVPMGFGGPHAAFLATTQAYSRKMPGRIIGVSVDSRGKPALRCVACRWGLFLFFCLLFFLLSFVVVLLFLLVFSVFLSFQHIHPLFSSTTSYKHAIFPSNALT